MMKNEKPVGDKCECRNCGTKAQGCRKGNMANWKSRKMSGRKNKCSLCVARHKAA